MNILYNLFLAHLLHNQYGIPAEIAYKMLEARENAPALNALNGALNNIRSNKTNVIKNSVIDKAFKCIEDLIDTSIKTPKDISNDLKDAQKRENKVMSKHIKEFFLGWLREKHISIV